MWIAVAALALLMVGLPLVLGNEWSFALLAVAGAVWLAGGRTRSGLVTLGVLSLIVLTRHIGWPVTQPLSFTSLPEVLLPLGLYAAEIYAWIFLMLQAARPQDPRAIAMEGEPEDWPMIDLYVPTGDEDVAVVRDTVFATLDMDYPRDRFRVYIMDDGHRPELQALAQEIGCGYLSRADDSRAKACKPAMEKPTLSVARSVQASA